MTAHPPKSFAHLDLPQIVPVRPLAPAAVSRRARLAVAVLTLTLSAPLIVAFAAGAGGGGAGALAIPLFALNTLWVAFGGAAALLGAAVLLRPNSAPRAAPLGTPTAVLYLLCNEPPEPVAAAAARLARDLERGRLDRSTDIFVLSDSAPQAEAAERAAFGALIAEGRVRYRRRARNTGRKPGNIADWARREGHRYAQMAVLDADSRMSAARLGAMIARMERAPRTGLIQSGMRLLPARSRLGRALRLSSRLGGPVATEGLAAWAGPAGNYWGHNALIRMRAYRAARRLPRLPGRAPLGGPVLSHDFVEAALIRRAGWDVEVSPESRGSFEDAPQTLRAFHKRDRRWCQGNLQHARLLGLNGFDPASRVHLATGVMSYLAAPVWLALVVLFATGLVPAPGLVLLAGVVALLLVQKMAALAVHPGVRRGGQARRIALRAGLAEAALSTLLAPLLLVRQTGAVISVLAGRDCGWKGPEAAAWRPPAGVAETGAGLALLALALGGGGAALPWLAPLVLPLLAAPALSRWLEAAA
ncbi:glucans biosynthesis glucosyltransferase MdoH [Rhodosalinus sp.]|uniref:glucans biosynthesis glucosyltransferase MdoH n=1 Tax=Rhodosalinus sp. TaxID=2047741 RepID=UPI003978CC2A